MNARGLVVPDAVAASWSEPAVARVSTAVTPAQPEAGSVAFAEVAGVPDGGLLFAVGAVSAGPKGGAAEAVAAGHGVMRAAAAHGSSPGEVLGMLGGSMRSQATAAWASGVVTVLSPATGALEIAEAGAAALLILGRDERFDLVLSDAPPVGAGKGALPSRLQLLLPGDRVALLSGGRISALADPACVAKAQHILETLPDRGGSGDGALAALAGVRRGSRGRVIGARGGRSASGACRRGRRLAHVRASGVARRCARRT